MNVCKGNDMTAVAAVFLFNDALQRNAAEVVIDGLFKFSQRSWVRQGAPWWQFALLPHCVASSRSSAAEMICAILICSAGAARM